MNARRFASHSALLRPREPDSRAPRLRRDGRGRSSDSRAGDRDDRCLLEAASQARMTSPVQWRRSFPITAAGQFRN